MDLLYIDKATKAYLVFKWVSCTNKFYVTSTFERFGILLMLGCCCMLHNIALSLVFARYELSAHNAME